MSFGRRVDLECDVVARVEVGEPGGEQCPAGLSQRRVAVACDIHCDACPSDPCRADPLGKIGGEEAGCKQFVPECGAGQDGGHPQVRIWRLA